MLYGDSGALFSPAKEEPRRSSLPSADRDPHQYKPEPTHWCVLVRENGAMEVRKRGRETPRAGARRLSRPGCLPVTSPPRAVDLPAAGLALGVPGEELPDGAAGAGRQLLRAAGRPRGRQKGGGDAARRAAAGEGGVAGGAGQPSEPAVPVGEVGDAGGKAGNVRRRARGSTLASSRRSTWSRSCSSTRPSATTPSWARATSKSGLRR